jgi:hypothetical protein
VNLLDESHSNHGISHHAKHLSTKGQEEHSPVGITMRQRRSDKIQKEGTRCQPAKDLFWPNAIDGWHGISQ